MEWWATVIIVVASNIVIGAVSICATRMQMKHSHKQWLRELKSAPLLALKSELAMIATKYENLLTAYANLFDSRIPVDTAGESLVQHSKELDTYAQGGEWRHTLFMIYDLDIKSNVNEIIHDYQTSAATIISTKSIESKNKEDLNNAINVSLRNKSRMEQVQLMIDNKLGEL